MAPGLLLLICLWEPQAQVPNGPCGDAERRDRRLEVPGPPVRACVCVHARVCGCPCVRTNLNKGASGAHVLPAGKHLSPPEIRWPKGDPQAPKEQQPDSSVGSPSRPWPPPPQPRRVVGERKSGFFPSPNSLLLLSNNSISFSFLCVKGQGAYVPILFQKNSNHRNSAKCFLCN